MASTTVSDIINFIIPIGIWVFIGWIIYKIPIVTEGIQKIIDWNSNRKNKKEENVSESNTVRRITYE